MNQLSSAVHLPTGDSQCHTRHRGAEAGLTLQVSCLMAVKKLQQPPTARPRKKRCRPWLGFITPTTSTCGRNWSLGTLATLASSNGFVMREPFPRLPAPRLDTERRGAVGVGVLKPVSQRPARVASVTVRAARLLDSEGRVAKGDNTRRTRNR